MRPASYTINSRHMICDFCGEVMAENGHALVIHKHDTSESIFREDPVPALPKSGRKPNGN